MYTALSAASKTLRQYLETALANDINLDSYFDLTSGGSMVVSMHTPDEMVAAPSEGLSIWLYQVVRDDQLLNQPPARIDENRVRRTPLPVRLHYLITPIVNTTQLIDGPETEQNIMGKVLQVFHDHPRIFGSDLLDGFSGTDVELNVRLEPLSLEEITRVWDALDRSYQLCISYEVSVVEIYTALEDEPVVPVVDFGNEYGVIVEAE